MTRGCRAPRSAAGVDGPDGQLLDLRIGAGDFLLSLGVAQEIGGGEVEPLDRRYDSILMHVSRQSRCYGLADFDMRVDIQADT